MPNKVYFSDTSDELAELRAVLVDQIRQTGMTPVWIEAAEKQRPDLLEIIKNKIADSDAFISILTYKSAWQPDGFQGQSLAELEYDAAQTAQKPTAVLLPRPVSEMGMYLRMRALGQSPEQFKAQHDFWNRVEKNGKVTYFASETDLTRQITRILNTWAADQGGGMTPVAVSAPSSDDTTVTANGIEVQVLVDRIAEKTAVKVQEIQQQRQEDLAEQTLKYNEALRLRPGELVFGRPSERRQFENDIFMIMPFAKEFTAIYRDTIVPVAKDLKLSIVRGDEFTSTSGIIMEEVWSALNHCRFVIADISSGNDNVFYELGIAHTLNKPAILLTQAKRPEDVPFDVRHLRYVQYSTTAAGLKKLGDDLKTAITRLIADLEEGWGSEA